MNVLVYVSIDQRTKLNINPLFLKSELPYHYTHYNIMFCIIFLFLKAQAHFYHAFIFPVIICYVFLVDKTPHTWMNRIITIPIKQNTKSVTSRYPIGP